MKFLEFDGVDVSRGQPIHMRQRTTETTTYQSNVRFQERPGQHPVREEVSYPELRIAFTVIRDEDDEDTEHADVMALFHPYGGLRAVTADFDGTEATVMADVVSFGRTDEGPNVYAGELATAGVFTATSATGPVTTSPVTVAGSLFALPQITVTGGGVAATRERYQVRDRTGRGLKAWDLRVPEMASEVWVNGALIPFAVVGGYTWFRVGVRHDKPTLVDIITGGPDSAAKDTLDVGNMVLEDSTNTVRTYAGWQISKNPGGASNQFRPGVSEALNRSTIALTYGVDNESDSQWHVRLTGSTVEHHRFALANDYVSAIYSSPVPVTRISGVTRTVRRRGYAARTQLSPTILEGAVTVARAGVRYRENEQEEWHSAWQRTLQARSLSPSTETSSDAIDFPNGAVQISFTLMVPPLGVTHETGELGQRGEILATYQHQPASDLYLSGDPVVTFDSSKVPEITHLGTVSGRFIESGNLINETTGHEISFERVYFDDAGLVIDCRRPDINAASGMHFGDTRETDPAHLFKLMRGDNVWSTSGDLTSATVSFEWTERFVG